MCKKYIQVVVFATILGVMTIPAGAGLVAYYPLDEGAGDVIVDASGNGHDGAVQSGPATWIDGQSGFGKALFFDGSNPARGYVNCGTWNPSAATGQLTVAFWIQYNGTNGNYQGVVSKRDDWDPEAAPPMMWYIECNQTSGALGFATRGSYPPGGGTPPVGQWAHIAVSFDGTTATTYVDGAEIGGVSADIGDVDVVGYVRDFSAMLSGRNG